MTRRAGGDAGGRVWTGLLLMASATLCGAQGAGPQFQERLFTTPAERRMLDRLRESAQEGGAPAAPRPAPVVAEPEPPADPVRLDGVVMRSGGPDTVWVDGEPVPSRAGTVSPELRIERGADDAGTVTLRARGASQAVRLKPGQRYDPGTGRVTEAFHTAAEPRGVTSGEQ